MFTIMIKEKAFERGVNIEENQLLTSSQVSKMLNVHMETLRIWRLIQKDKLPYIRIGRLIRYKKSDVEALIQNGSCLVASSEAGSNK